MTHYYTGIGSRSTPLNIQKNMINIAAHLAKHNFILRSGGAEGADTAFELGSKIEGHKNKLCEIYLPWQRFNKRPARPPYYWPPSKEAMELAAKYHPAWNRCSEAAKLLHARNSYQVLGKDLKTPSEFIVCWHQNTGGTMQAIRIATDFKIPVYNLADGDIKPKIYHLMESIKTWNEY